MNCPLHLKVHPPVGPIALGGPLLELIGLGISALAALVFVTYLLRCYLQEFWRAHRVQRRKRLARLKSFSPEADREAVIEGCQRRRASAMTPEPTGLLPDLDWRGLHSFIPSHDRITLVWDTGRPNDGALPRFCVVSEAAEEETITGNGEIAIR